MTKTDHVRKLEAMASPENIKLINPVHHKVIHTEEAITLSELIEFLKWCDSYDGSQRAQDDTWDERHKSMESPRGKEFIKELR